MRRAQGKMLCEYFSGVSIESLSRGYGYSVIKIKTRASDFIYQCELTQERRTCHPATSHHKRLNIHADSPKLEKPNSGVRYTFSPSP